MADPQPEVRDVLLPRHATDEVPVELRGDVAAGHLSEPQRQVPLFERPVYRRAELVEEMQEGD
jgi:hypothetical protein